MQNEGGQERPADFAQLLFSFGRIVRRSANHEFCRRVHRLGSETNGLSRLFTNLWSPQFSPRRAPSQIGLTSGIHEKNAEFVCGSASYGRDEKGTVARNRRAGRNNPGKIPASFARSSFVSGENNVGGE